MSTTTRTMAATPEQVWEVLRDGWLYAIWVVGASRMREVDDHWPAVGAQLHHSVGTWPALIDDTTEVLELTPGARLVLKARGWPMGEARVEIKLRALGATTEVEMIEDAVSGPGLLMPKPLRQPPLHWRNTEALRRLSYIVENRHESRHESHR